MKARRFHLIALPSWKPTRRKTHIDPGKIEGGVYRNPALGFTYQVPPGWLWRAEGAVLPAIERARASDSLDGLLGDSTRVRVLPNANS